MQWYRILMFAFVCVAAFATVGCGESGTGPVITGVGAEILHEDGRTSSGYRELWSSPQLSGDNERFYREGAEEANEGFDPDNLVYDKHGRLWLACRGDDKQDYCGFDLVAYICREKCTFDLKVRMVGPLAQLPDEGAPWEQESAENWASGSFDWAKTAKRDRWGYVLESSEDVGGTPSMQVQVKNGGLEVLLFPNRTF